MKKKNEVEFHEALRKYSENFNSLPFEVRKGLPRLIHKVARSDYTN